MDIQRKDIFTSEIFLDFLYNFICLYSKTFDVTVINEKKWIDYLDKGGNVLLCAWHQQFFPAIYYFRKYKKYNPCLMISRSKDGTIISGVAERIGWDIVRGSSSKGGTEALIKIIEKFKKAKLAAHILDGPRGPIGVVKPGAIQLSQATNSVIVPLYTNANRALYFNSWDKFFIPKPYSKVSIIFGDMIKFERTQSKDILETQRSNLEKIMRPYLKKASPLNK
ncbi:MAG: lysophospholipid acyltransferase family protein [Desulfobacterales bacterium]|nr:lysophospholipid acyltransferase family protein [Desulfobacterales bacterium]